MKVYNLIWGFSLGAGIDKCFLTYTDLSEVDNEINVHSVCVNLKNLGTDLSALHKKNVQIVNIKKQLDFSWIRKLSKSINETSPDKIFTHGFNGAIMVLLLRILKGIKVPLICTYHGLYHSPTNAKKILEPIYNGLSLFVYKFIADKVICVEKMSVKYLISKGVPKEKLVTVYNGLKPLNNIKKIDFKEFNISNEKLTIITASRISEVKGLPYLLQSIAEIKRKTKIPFQYIMLGDGPDLESLKKMAIELNIMDYVSFVGYQSNVIGWLDTADIFALPSLAEYHSIALLEAMRSGKAIVATHVGGNSESVRHKKEGLLVPSKNVAKLSESLLKLINNESMRLNYGIAAKERFHNIFSERSMKQNIVKVLKS
jgi:glycosyltransferase involved in cell wall biosynthesis